MYVDNTIKLEFSNIAIFYAGIDPGAGKGRGTNRVIGESRFSCCIF